MSPPAGILVLDKPAGVSSTGVLNRLKRVFPRGTKLGHAGTLDPFATGVLLALVGKATKRCESLMGSPKTYLARVRIDATTDTLDPESEERPVTPPPGRVLTRETVEAVLAAMSAGGEVLQRPPAYSALKVGGRRAYDLARAGKPVEPEPRMVKVYRLALGTFDPPEFEIEAEVGRGFYVRSLARDLGEALGSSGYLRALRRTRVGPYAAADAIDPGTITAENVGTLLRD